MNRKEIQSIGLVVALILAGISLPIGIISFNQPPINYISNHYYNYYNTTNYYDANATGTGTDYSNPLEKTIHIGLAGQTDYFTRIFNFSQNEIYWFYWDKSNAMNFRMYALRAYVYENVFINIPPSARLSFLLGAHEYSDHSDYMQYTGSFSPPYLDEWHLVYIAGDMGTLNVNLTDEIISI